MFARRSAPFVTAATRLPTPAPAVLFPNPLTTFVIPLPARDFDWGELEGVFVAILSKPVANDDARVTDCSRDGQNLEVALSYIAQRVEIVHLVANIKERVFRVVAGCR